MRSLNNTWINEHRIVARKRRGFYYFGSSEASRLLRMSEPWIRARVSASFLPSTDSVSPFSSFCLSRVTENHCISLMSSFCISSASGSDSSLNFP